MSPSAPTWSRPARPVRVLVTGSSGRVGRAIWVRLAHGHEVIGLDRAPSSTAQVVADLGDEAALSRALQGCEALVHTAALHAPHVDRVNDAEFERVNVAATRRLFDLAAGAGVSRIVLTSTTALYGDAATPPDRAGWVDETLAPQPRTVYHRSKLAAEAVLAEAAARHGLSATVLRMSRCFPEPAPLMAVYRLHRGVDARDVARAHEFALGIDEPGFRCWVVSGATPFEPGDATALRRDAGAVLRERAPQWVDALARRGWALPRSIDRVYVPRALQALGWVPRHGPEAVLRQFDEESSEVLPPASAHLAGSTPPADPAAAD